MTTEGLGKQSDFPAILADFLTKKTRARARICPTKEEGVCRLVQSGTASLTSVAGKNEKPGFSYNFKVFLKLKVMFFSPRPAFPRMKCTWQSPRKGSGHHELATESDSPPSSIYSAHCPCAWRRDQVTDVSRLGLL